MYVIQHCFICRPSETTVSEDAGIEPRSVAALTLTARRSNHSARSHTHSARFHPHSARSHPVLNPVLSIFLGDQSFLWQKLVLKTVHCLRSAVHDHSLWLRQRGMTAILTTCKTLPPRHPSQPTWTEISTCSHLLQNLPIFLYDEYTICKARCETWIYLVFASLRRNIFFVSCCTLSFLLQNVTGRLWFHHAKKHKWRAPNHTGWGGGGDQPGNYRGRASYGTWGRKVEKGKNLWKLLISSKLPIFDANPMRILKNHVEESDKNICMFPV